MESVAEHRSAGNKREHSSVDIVTEEKKGRSEKLVFEREKKGVSGWKTKGVSAYLYR